jgi:hypothetical protein
MPLRVWNGSVFTTAITARVWDGSSFVPAKSAKVWNGSSWVNFLSSVNIQDASDLGSDANFDNAQASAGYILYNNGSAETYNSGGGFTFPTTLTGQWLVGGLVSDFSVRATITSQFGGTTNINGTFDTWISLSTTREWSVTVTAVGNDDQQNGGFVMTVDIAYTADTSKIIDTATIQLDAVATVI